MSAVTVFFILLVAVFATLAFFTEPSEADKRIQQRLGQLDRRRTVDDEDQTEIVKRVTFSSIPWFDHILRHTKSALQLHLILEQAKVPWTAARFFFYSSIVMLAGSIIGHYWIPVGFVGWIPGLVLGFLPLMYVLYRRSARFAKFQALLPDAIDLIARALRAGHSLPSSLLNVAEEIDDPLGPEFKYCADEMNFGLPFRDAMQNLMRRFPLQDLQFLVSAILMQRETGGNLPELLDKTAVLLRARIHLQQKVKVYTAQGRMTGMILLALPFVAFVLLNLANPGYTAPLYQTDTGVHMIYITLASMALGAIVIRRIVQVKY
jgi:tight adherence protein B